MNDTLARELRRLESILSSVELPLEHNAPATETQITRLEQRVGFTFHEDLKAFWKWSNGCGRRCAAVMTDELTGCHFPAIESALEAWSWFEPYDELSRPEWLDDRPRDGRIIPRRLHHRRCSPSPSSTGSPLRFTSTPIPVRREYTARSSPTNTIQTRSTTWRRVFWSFYAFQTICSETTSSPCYSWTTLNAFATCEAPPSSRGNYRRGSISVQETGAGGHLRTLPERKVGRTFLGTWSHSARRDSRTRRNDSPQSLHALTISNPRIVPVLVAKWSASMPMRWSMETKRFGSG